MKFRVNLLILYIIEKCLFIKPKDEKQVVFTVHILFISKMYPRQKS